MAGSVLGKLYIDPVLSNFAVSYKPQGFIAQDVMPIIPVQKQSGIYAVLEQADQFRSPDTSRSPGSEAKIVRFRVGSDNYNCRNWALKSQIAIEDLANADPVFLSMLEQGRTGTVMNQLLLDWEIRAATKMFTANAANVGSYATVASAWNVAAGGGSPFNDINTAIDNIHNATGYYPNTLVFGIQAWKSFRRHNEIINKAQRTTVAGGAPMASIDQVRELFEIENVLVGRAYKNTAQELKTQTLLPVWSTHVWVGFQKMNAQTTEDPTALAAFRWNVPGVPSMQVERLPYDAKIKAQEIEVGYYQDEKTVALPLSFLVAAVNG